MSPRRVALHGFRLSVASTLDAHTKRMLYRGRYQRRKVRQLASKVEPNDVFLDLGAGLGLTALFASSMVGQEHVVAVEADPSAITLALGNFAANGCVIELIEAAAAAGDSKETDFFPNATFGASSCFPRAGGIEPIRVATLDLATLLTERRVTVANVDVVGAEHALLTGIDDFAQVRVLLVDVYERTIGYPRSVALVRHLFDCGFALDLAFSCAHQLVFARATAAA